MQTIRQHKGRTYMLHARGEGPFRGRFVVKGDDDGNPGAGASSWHDLEDEFVSAEDAVHHADAVAQQYIATFADQA
ncbi:MAG: hypothetical protein ABW220_06785 [Burkholderiaceae bacterium]